MAEVQIGFEWPVAVNGYEIVNYGPPKKGKTLLGGDLRGKHIVAKPGPWAMRRPLEFHKTLFAQFSELGEDTENWVAFANSFGLLSVHSTILTDSSKPAVPSETAEGICESLLSWQRSIQDMADAVQAWQTGTLRLPEETVRIASLAVTLSEGPNRTFALKLLPNSLNGAMRLQFAQAVASDKPLRACDECGQWFEMTKRPPGRLPGKPEPHRFCSNRCRSKYHNRRIREALS